MPPPRPANIRSAIKEKAEQMETRLAALQQTCDAQAALLQQLVGLFGVVVPAWLTREEVERGDDMGLVRPSAEGLELTVVFEILQNTPGYSDGDVVWISPAAGTLIVRGSTVKVGVNSVGR